MSYCVNCGVELSGSEKYCPLCNVEVFNPKEPWKEPAERPYSHHLDTLVKRVDRRYFATLAALFMAIPMLITLLYDIVADGSITWSAYVVGAIALLFIFVILPLYFKKYHTVIFLSANCAAVLLFLLFIESANGGNWFMTIGLPVTVVASVEVIILALLFTKQKSITFLLKMAYILIAAGVLAVCIELIISASISQAVLGWSVYVLVPCAVLSIAALILEHRKNLKEEIKRRLFY